MSSTPAVVFRTTRAVAERVRIAAPAKVNLRLKVLARETSGFHSLETVFCAVSLRDEIEIAVGPPGIKLRSETGASLGPDQDNLAVRAAVAFFEAIGRSPALEIRLIKRIPVAAGLGGGSSDAAAVLRALCTLNGQPIAHHDLLQIGSEIGSDVPFFLGDSTLALGWGRGERLLSLPPLPPRPVLIAHPDAGLPTPLAFDHLARTRPADFRAPAFHIPVESLHSWRAVAEIAENDFSPVAERLRPETAPAIRLLRECGASPALLSGSGAAIFGVFQEAPALRVAATRLTALGFRTWTAESLSRFPAARVDPRGRLG
jgi:4-diphosphocytidyl-2-C-methyl-D-erythritol kinase